MYETSKLVFPHAVVEQYSCGSMVGEKSMSNSSSPLPFGAGPNNIHSLSSNTMALITLDCGAIRLPEQHDGSNHLGLCATAFWLVYTLDPAKRSDGFATSLYAIPEIGQTRAQFRATAANARAHNVTLVTPWLALGQGYRRSIPSGSNYWDPACEIITPPSLIHFCEFERLFGDQGIMATSTAGCLGGRLRIRSTP